MSRKIRCATENVFHLPAGLEDMRGNPFYVLIAVWGLRKGQILTTTLVSRTFLITQNQARDALHYIRHDGASSVCSESVPIIEGKSPPGKGVRILAVNLSEKLPVPHKRPTEEKIALNSVSTRLPRQTPEVNSLRRLRRWMVSRRCGELAPQELLSGHN